MSRNVYEIIQEKFVAAIQKVLDGDEFDKIFGK